MNSALCTAGVRQHPWDAEAKFQNDCPGLRTTGLRGSETSSIRPCSTQKPYGAAASTSCFLFCQNHICFPPGGMGGAEHTFKSWLGALGPFHWRAGFGGEF